MSGDAAQVAPHQVLEWFKLACQNKKWPVPSLEQCAKIAPEISHAARLSVTYNNPTPLGEAEKHGRLFIKHLPAAKRKMENMRRDKSIPPEALVFFLGMLDEMRLAEKHVKSVLDHLSWPNPRHSWHDSARSIRISATSAWIEAGKVPRSENPDDPMCIFVTLALAAINMEHSAEAVSDALRGRTGIGVKKKGQKVSKKSP